MNKLIDVTISTPLGEHWFESFAVVFKNRVDGNTNILQCLALAGSSKDYRLAFVVCKIFSTTFGPHFLILAEVVRAGDRDRST